MPLYSSEALILRTYKLGEADRIVVFLTRDRGKKRGVAKGARRPRSRFVGGLEPLTTVRVAYFEKERRELVSVNYSEPCCSPLSATDPDALGYAQYFAELLDEWAQEADHEERLYRLGAAMVEAFAAGVKAEPLARYFEYWLLRLQGVYPPSEEWRVSAPARAFLVSARSVNPLQIGALGATSEVLREIELVHRALISTHLEKELKSIRVLRDMKKRVS